MNKHSYSSLLKAILVTFMFSFQAINVLAQTPPASCTASIGSPANGTSHYLSVTWDAVGGATSYDLQYSTDGTNWNPLSSGSAATTYNHNTGAIGNMPFYYRVRTVVGAGQSAWKNCSQFPIYTACDNPALPQLGNATSSSMTVTLIAESPDANPSYTTYSIYCTTTSQYVQANGTLGASEIFQTRAVWGTVTVTGLSASANYCFYAKAKNMDGDVRIATGGTIIAVEPFTTNSNFSTAGPTGPTNRFWSPSTCTTGGLKYNSTGGCPDGYVGFSGAWNNYFGCFLRTPAWDCSGNTSVIINFDLSNSYIASHIKSSPSSSDAIRFYMWVDGGYKQASSVTIGGTEVSSKDGNGTWLKFDVARTCVNVNVTFDLSTSTNLSGILFYLEPNCSYNDSQPFSVGIDNVSLQQSGGAATACLSTTACNPVSFITEPFNQTICEGGDVSFSVSISGDVMSYQWQESSNGGSTWINLSNTSVYSTVNTTTLNIKGVPGSMTTNRYRCVVTGSCGGSITSTQGILVVNPLFIPSFTLTYAASPICSGANVSFSVSQLVGGGTNPKYQWKKNGVNVGSNSTVYFDNNLQNGDVVIVEITSNDPCASPSVVTSVPDPFTVLPKVTPSVSVMVSQTTICPGTPLTFTAKPVNGGTPVYEWKKNGNNVGTNSMYYSDNTLLDNDFISVTMTSTAQCAQPTTVFSPDVTITVANLANAGSVSTVRDTICSGTPVNVVTNGSTGTIQWQSAVTPSGFADIPSANSESYVGPISQPTYFRTIARSGSCTDTSDAVKVELVESPAGNFSFSMAGRKVTFNSAGITGNATAFDWNFADGSSHSTDPNPVHTYSADGLYHVCLDVKNGSNCSFTVCHDITVSAPTSIYSVSNEGGWKIYPNPVNDKLIVQGNLSNTIIELQNILGQTLYSETFNGGNSSAVIDLSEFAQGIYFLKIIADKKEFVQRIVKE